LFLTGIVTSGWSYALFFLKTETAVFCTVPTKSYLNSWKWKPVAVDNSPVLVLVAVGNLSDCFCESISSYWETGPNSTWMWVHPTEANAGSVSCLVCVSFV